VDAKELIQQTKFTPFEAKNKTFPNDRVIVGMSQTIHSRLKKDTEFLKRFDLVIVDEAHVWVHNSIFEFLRSDCKIIGFTATPVRLTRTTFLDERGEEWTREQLMSDVYNDIVCGPEISELIEMGYLVDEQLAVIQVKGLENLKTDGQSGEYTNDSLNEVFDNNNYAVDVLTEYEKYCKGKKTILYNSTTKTNLRIFNLFVAAGYNCRMYDSVNSEITERRGVVEWFRNTPDAILFNVNVFTKGFDVRDVEAIILARATASLSLFIQIAGRGARTTDQIFKDRFMFVDGGGNAAKFGMWSAPRDWRKIFFHGLKPIKKKREALEDVKDCKECGAIVARHETICPYCGHVFVVKPKKVVVTETKIVKVVYPSFLPIYNYTKANKEDVFFALKVLNNQILSMFIDNDVSFDSAIKAIKSGEFKRKMQKYYAPVYRKLIYSDLPSSSNRTYQYQFEILTKTILRYYKK